MNSVPRLPQLWCLRRLGPCPNQSEAYQSAIRCRDVANELSTLIFEADTEGPSEQRESVYSDRWGAMGPAYDEYLAASADALTRA